MQGRTLLVSSPAKVNLHLGVGARRPDGYHELQTVFHTLELCDYLAFELSDAPAPDALESSDDAAAPEPFDPCAGPLEGVLIHSQPPFDFPVDKNLIFRALSAFAQALGRPIVEPGQRLTVQIQKNIPAQAGLGGGSSNAAAALLAAATLWGVDPLGETCLEVAASLGADVPFFLYGGCAHMSGKGEIMLERFEPLDFPVLLLNTGEGVSTAQAYRVFDSNPPAARDIAPLLSYLRLPAQRRQAAELGTLLHNNLQPAAFQIAGSLARLNDWLEQYKAACEAATCDDACGAATSEDACGAATSEDAAAPFAQLMSGSGSAFFALFQDEEQLWPLSWDACAWALDAGLPAPLQVDASRFSAQGVSLL